MKNITYLQMNINKKFEEHWENTYGTGSDIWDDEYDEANHKDVAGVAYKQAVIDTFEKIDKR